METSAPDWLYRQLVEGSQDGIIFADPDGSIRLWNQGAEAIFGFRAQEVLGQSLDLIIPPQLRERHWEGYRKVMATGVTKYGSQLLSVPAVRKDGRRISIEFTVIPVKNAQGGMLGIAAIIRDATERWERERNMKKRLAELEKSA